MAKKAPIKRDSFPAEFARATAEIRKAATKPPAKRKPRPKKPVVPAVVPVIDPIDDGGPLVLRSWILPTLKAVLLIAVGVGAGIWFAGGIDVGPTPLPVANDCLSQSHVSDRVSQVAVLRELAAQPFDGTNGEGRKKAGEWFNAQRFRNRANDFGAYTDAVSEAIAGNAEAELAAELEGK